MSRCHHLVTLTRPRASYLLWSASRSRPSVRLIWEQKALWIQNQSSSLLRLVRWKFTTSKILRAGNMNIESLMHCNLQRHSWQIPDMQMKPLPLLLTLKASWSERCTPSSPQKPISDESLCRPLPERARGIIMAEYSLAPFHLIRYAAPCLALLITSPLQPPVICSCAQDIFMKQ